MGLITHSLAPKPVLAAEGAVTDVVTIISSCVDARSTGATHRLQAGLVLGIITASGKYDLYNRSGTDNGCRVAAVILAEDCNMKGNDESVAVADKKAKVIVIGKVKADACATVDAYSRADLAKNGAGRGFIIFEG